MPVTERFHPGAPSAEKKLERVQAGTRLGRYTLLSQVGAGGMATVWAARHTNDLGFQKIVAVKMIRPELAADSTMRRMFLEEAQLAGRIRHSNVVEVLDLGEEEDLVYLVMSFIEGTSLSSLVSGMQPTRLPVGVAVRIVLDVLAGLHAAHELRADDGAPLGLVHRDVSPQNVLVGRDGISKLTDFGIAKINDSAATVTEPGEVKGKFSYMAPEQVRAEAPTRRSDVFAMGVVAWELFSGRSLYGGTGRLEIIKRRLQGEPAPDLLTVAPDIASEIASVTMRALREDPGARYATAAAMAEALEHAARGSIAGAREVADLVEARTAGVTPRISVLEATATQVDQELPTDVSSEERPNQARRRVVLPFFAGVAAVAGVVFVTTRTRPPEPRETVGPPAPVAPPTQTPAASFESSALGVAVAPATSASSTTLPSMAAASATAPRTHAQPPSRQPARATTAPPVSAGFRPPFKSPYEK
ncbi:MAG: serine/threonine protein kinase [Deltaproteobacteria bacterium]|nr:serine/threonine protein kinase [Deltaproteobacteria bacterium]